MNNATALQENAAPASEQSFRKFSFRVLLIWMFASFAYWFFNKHLPSVEIQLSSVREKVPQFIKAFTLQQVQPAFFINEIVFSTTLLLCFFLPRFVPLIILHVLSAIFLALSLFVVSNGMTIPFLGYIIILFAFIFRKENTFSEAFDFLQTIVVCCMLWYAATVFYIWRDYLAQSFSLYIINNNNDTQLDAHSTVAKNIMPWYYIVYFVFVIRIFTKKYNGFLFYFACIIIFLEYFFNTFFDPLLLIMLVPFINWQKFFKRFNKKFEPK